MCALVFGLVMVRLTPPMQTYDEQDHFFRAYQLTDFNIRPDIVTLVPTRPSLGPGGQIPTNVAGFAYDFLYSTRLAHTKEEKRSKLHTNFAKYKSTKVDPQITSPAHFPNTGSYSPVVYIPQTAAIEIGKLARLPIVVFFYLARIFNLLAWAAIVWLAIRMLPAGKWLMMTLALLPVSLFQAATVSADALTNALTFLVVALFVHYCFTKRTLQRKDYAVMLVVTATLSLCKSGFWPFALIFWLVPVARFASKKSFILFNTANTFASLALSAIWLQAIKYVIPYIGSIYRVGLPISYEEQISGMLHQPFDFVVIMLRQFTDLHLLNYWFQHGTGVMGWGEAPIPPYGFILVVLVLLFAVLVSSVEKPSSEYGIKQRIGTGLLALFAVVYMAASLYASFTPLHKPVIDGIQGRYFIPYSSVLVPIVIGWAAKYHKKLASIRNHAYLLAPASAAILVIAVMAIYGRYYA